MELLANCTYISLVLSFLVSSLIKSFHLIDNSTFDTIRNRTFTNTENHMPWAWEAKFFPLRHSNLRKWPPQSY
ncbi:hypothetical protein ACB098_07G156100 [Castanea mollissima]